MPQIAFIFIVIMMIASDIVEDKRSYARMKIITTAIRDNGCSKQAQIELKPAVYNDWPNNKGVM